MNLLDCMKDCTAEHNSCFVTRCLNCGRQSFHGAIIDDDLTLRCAFCNHEVPDSRRSILKTPWPARVNKVNK